MKVETIKCTFLGAKVQKIIKERAKKDTFLIKERAKTTEKLIKYRANLIKQR